MRKPGTPLQYSCLENPMDGGAWWAAVHGVARSWTRLSNFTLFFHFHALDVALGSLETLDPMKVRSESEVAQSCPTLSDPVDCSPLGSSIHGIL